MISITESQKSIIRFILVINAIIYTFVCPYIEIRILISINDKIQIFNFAHIFNIPIGTGIGIYIIYNILYPSDTEDSEIFEQIKKIILYTCPFIILYSIIVLIALCVFLIYCSEEIYNTLLYYVIFRTIIIAISLIYTVIEMVMDNYHDS